MKKLTLTLILLSLSSQTQASEIVHQFKNPSFSGVNASAHWLTIENQEATRRKAIQDKIEAELKAKATEEKNSILNRFLNNLQSRIYSQLAAQLTANLFAGGSDSGSFVLDGNIIEYLKDGEEVSLTITDENGGVTKITIPVSGFKF